MAGALQFLPLLLVEATGEVVLTRQVLGVAEGVVGVTGIGIGIATQTVGYLLPDVAEVIPHHQGVKAGVGEEVVAVVDEGQDHEVPHRDLEVRVTTEQDIQPKSRNICPRSVCRACPLARLLVIYQCIHVASLSNIQNDDCVASSIKAVRAPKRSRLF
jgi:hypothetical protein